MKIKSDLFLTFGNEPNDQFCDDIRSVEKLNEKDVFQIIDKIVEWYPKENISAEWEKWSKNFSDEEKEIRKGVIRFILYIARELYSEKIKKEELIEDAKEIEFPLKYINYLVEKAESKENFIKSAKHSTRPYLNTIKSIDWSFNKRYYIDGTKEDIALLELSYYLYGESKTIQLDLNYKAVSRLISMLKKIKSELKTIK